MKPILTAALLALPFLAIFVFYKTERPMVNQPANRPTAGATTASAEADKELAKYTAPQKTGVMTDDAKRQVKEMRENTSKLGTVAALLRTEEVQRGMVNKEMARLAQVYQPLFDKWSLTNAERQAILDILRRREATLTSIRTAAQKDGSEAVLKSIRVITSERARYAQEISQLIDSEKMREFNEVDTQDYNRLRVKLRTDD